MKYRRLGSTGTLVSELCLGGMTFGADTDEDEARRVLRVNRTTPTLASPRPKPKKTSAQGKCLCRD